MILHGSDRPDLLIVETLPDILEATILRHPDAVAIHWQDQSITYETLGRRADLAAHHLIEAGAAGRYRRPVPAARGRTAADAGRHRQAGAAWLPFESIPARAHAGLPAGRRRAVHRRRRRGPARRHRHLYALAAVAAGGRFGALRRRAAAARASGLRHLHLRFHRQAQGVPITQASICHFLRSENEVLGVRHGDKVYQGFRWP